MGDFFERLESNCAFGAVDPVVRFLFRTAKFKNLEFREPRVDPF
jgi:hypothetical protein